MPKTGTLALAAVVTLAGCGQWQAESTGGASTLAATAVDVTVDSSGVKVQPDPALVGTQNGSIKWALHNSGSCTYVFPADGIAFPWPPPVAPPADFACSGIGDPTTRFNNCGPKHGGSEFHCNAVGRPVQDLCYYYSIKLVSAQANCPTLPIDPWAKNK